MCLDVVQNICAGSENSWVNLPWGMNFDDLQAFRVWKWCCNLLWGQHGDGNSSWFTTMGNGYQTYTHDIRIFHYSIRLPIRGRTCKQTVNQHFWWKHERCEWMGSEHLSFWYLQIGAVDSTSNAGTMNRHEMIVEKLLILASATPPKFNIEPENDGLEDDFPFPGWYSQVPC